MVRRLLPQAGSTGALREDEADALAVALCHAQRSAARTWGMARGAAARGRAR
jgi:Holliday junction resolvasome RuvABC endonuclease subunit